MLLFTLLGNLASPVHACLWTLRRTWYMVTSSQTEPLAAPNPSNPSCSETMWAARYFEKQNTLLQFGYCIDLTPKPPDLWTLPDYFNPHVFQLHDWAFSTPMGRKCHGDSHFHGDDCDGLCLVQKKCEVPGKKRRRRRKKKLLNYPRLLGIESSKMSNNW